VDITQTVIFTMRLHDFTPRLSRIEDEDDEAVVPYRDQDDQLEDDTILDMPILAGGQEGI
jgi:hypothetical protein